MASWSTTPEILPPTPRSWPSQGQLLEGKNGPRVLLMNGSRQEIDHQTGRLEHADVLAE